MNPFEEEEETVTVQKENSITIWKENRGRKINTYITGWNIDVDDLKSYLKEFKQSKGCNGSIKIEEDNTYKLHFQGDKIDDFIEFMLSKGIDKDSITIKGQ